MVILFLLIFALIYQIFRFKVFNRISNGILNKAEFEYEKRKSEKEELRILEGNFKETRFLNKLDSLLEQSGIKKKFKFINAEIYIVLNIFMCLIGFLIGIFILNYWLWGLIIDIVAVIVFYGALKFLQGINYTKIDREMLTFLNLLENFSATEDDIVQIINQTYRYLQNPLKEYLMDFSIEVQSTGNMAIAFRKLEAKIENEKLSSFIRNIEICSRHEANYREIIEDERSSMQGYLRAKQKRKAINQNGRIEIFVCIAMSILIICIFTSLTPNLFNILKNSFTGNLILLYNVVVLGILGWNMISFDKN